MPEELGSLRPEARLGTERPHSLQQRVSKFLIPKSAFDTVFMYRRWYRENIDLRGETMKKLIYGIVCAIGIVALPLNLSAQTQSKEKAKQNRFQLTAGTPVTGSGTVGNISKWLSLNSIGGKKAGRFIERGTTVILKVRNADGGQSAPFMFTRRAE
jgi:hypothetical protein